MPSLGVKITAANYLGPLREYQKLIERRMEYAALVATDKAAQRSLISIRSDMKGAGLGNLGNGISSGSDLRKGNGVKRRGKGFSASGWVHIRSKSERSRGAIEAYTNGATIRPIKGRWLWIPTDNIPRISKRYRLTPALWKENGLDTRIGPLQMVMSINGRPLLVVKNTTVALSGRKRSARAHLKNGRPGKGQVDKQFLVAFIGIPSTTRAARLNVPAIMAREASSLGDLFYEALEAN